MVRENLTKAQADELLAKIQKRKYEWVMVTKNKNGRINVHYTRKMWDKNIENLARLGRSDVLAPPLSKTGKFQMSARLIANNRVAGTVKLLGRKLTAPEQRIIGHMYTEAEKVRGSLMLDRFECKFGTLVEEFPELKKAFWKRMDLEDQVMSEAEAELDVVNLMLEAMERRFKKFVEKGPEEIVAAGKARTKRRK